MKMPIEGSASRKLYEADGLLAQEAAMGAQQSDEAPTLIPWAEFAAAPWNRVKGAQ